MLKRLVLAILFFAAMGSLPTLVSGQQKATQPFTITIVAPVLSVTTPPSAILNGILSKSYPAVQFSATGGVAPYTWSTMGTPPPGISISSSGSFGGTPTTVGTYTFGVQAKDSQATPATAAQQYTMIVAAQLVISSSPLPNATVGVPYSQLIAVSGGTGPYSCSATGSLPGMTVTGGASGCTVAGSASQTGAFPFTLTVIDSSTGTFARVNQPKTVEYAFRVVK